MIQRLLGAGAGSRCIGACRGSARRGSVAGWRALLLCHFNTFATWLWLPAELHDEIVLAQLEHLGQLLTRHGRGSRSIARCHLHLLHGIRIIGVNGLRHVGDGVNATLRYYHWVL